MALLATTYQVFSNRRVHKNPHSHTIIHKLIAHSQVLTGFWLSKVGVENVARWRGSLEGLKRRASRGMVAMSRAQSVPWREVLPFQRSGSDVDAIPHYQSPPGKDRSHLDKHISLMRKTWTRTGRASLQCTPR